MDTTKGPIPLCCIVNPYNKNLCTECEQTSCIDHQSVSSLWHKFCEPEWYRIEKAKYPEGGGFINDPYHWGMPAHMKGE